MEKISAKIPNKELNGTTIWVLLVYGPLIFSFIFYLLFNMAVSQSIKIGNTTPINGVGSVMWLLMIIYTVAFITLDRKFLLKNNAVAPSQWWFFLFPVYVFRRQYLNNAGLHVFWIYLVMNWIYPPVAYKIIAHAVVDSLR